MASRYRISSFINISKIKDTSSLRHITNFIIIAAASLSQAGAIFLKGVVLARILGTREFGLCVIILSVTGALDIFADAGIDRFIVQTRFGYRDDVMRTSHAFRVFGSIIVAAAIVALSYPISLLFHAKELILPIASTGGIIIIRGFSNLSYKLQQRSYRFEKETFIDVVRFTLDVIVAAIVALLTHSFLAVLAGAFANALSQLFISHIIATHSYSFKPRPYLVKLVGRFSVPIYMNATILFAAMQGDRMVVAGLFTKTEVALYAVSCTLGQGLAGLIGKISERLLLPVFSKSRNSFQLHRRQVVGVGTAFIVGSVIFQILVSAFAPFLIKEIYGSAYTGIAILIYAAAIFQMIQIQQSWLNSVLISNGRTAPLPRITLVRSVAFPVAILMVLSGCSLIAVPLAFAFGAAASLGISYWEASRLGLMEKNLPIASFVAIGASIVLVIIIAYGGTRAGAKVQRTSNNVSSSRDFVGISTSHR
jgi:O-antigen/teichoic acid export membrane protein